MTEPYEMLSLAYIRAWIAGLVAKGGLKGARGGATLDAVAGHTDIPRNSLFWLANKDTAKISPARQRLLSKVIAQIENGQLVFERARGRTVARLVEAPRPRVRYGFALSAAGPRLVAIDRPKAFRPMPAFRDIFKR